MIGGFVVLCMVTAAVASWLVESVTAETQARTRESETSSTEELARLRDLIDRLNDRPALDPDESDNGAGQRKPSTEPDQGNRQCKLPLPDAPA